MSEDKITDGEHTVSADQLRPGERYVLREEEDGRRHMELLPRRPVEDSWPRLSVSPQSLQMVRTFTRGMGRNQGARPPLSWVASILLEHACNLPDAQAIVREGILAMMMGEENGENETLTQTADKSDGVESDH